MIVPMLIRATLVPQTARKPAAIAIELIGRRGATLYPLNPRASDPGVHAVRVHCIAHELEIVDASSSGRGDSCYYFVRPIGPVGLAYAMTRKRPCVPDSAARLAEALDAAPLKVAA